VSAILGTSVPPEVVAALSDHESPRRFFDQLDLKRPGVRRHLADLMSLPTWLDRLEMIRERLFPDAAYMQQRFGANTR
jgi:hypothetical protein